MKMIYKVLSIVLLIGSVAAINAGVKTSAEKKAKKAKEKTSKAAKSAAKTAGKGAGTVAEGMSAVGQAQMNPAGAVVGHPGY